MQRCQQKDSRRPWRTSVTHSRGPVAGWRWTPPAKEACKSHLYYQARYSLQGQVTLGAWRQFGFFRSDRWVHFRPTHPCAGWPDEFCALFTDFVKAGEQHVVELTPALSASRRLVVRADTACIVTNSCGVIGGAPPTNASAHPDATDDVDLDDSDLTTTPATLPARRRPSVSHGSSAGGGGRDHGGCGPASPDDCIMPLYISNVPFLDRAHEDMLLVKLECTQYCKNVFWQYKVAGESAWKTADAEVHSEFHSQYFFVNRLRPDTLYVLRALLKPSFGPAYAGDVIPTLEARTCPEQPPPVENLRAHSAGPGWLELRWSPVKEPCRSRLYYQARYSVLNTTLDTWIDLGHFSSNHWVSFRPTHPCAGWPDEFCALFTDFVKAGEQHVVEVRVSRYGESTSAVSASRRLVVRADTACIVTNSCGVIGGAPSTNASAHPDATDDVDLDDSDLTTTPATFPAVRTRPPGRPPLLLGTSVQFRRTAGEYDDADYAHDDDLDSDPNPDALAHAHAHADADADAPRPRHHAPSRRRRPGGEATLRARRHSSRA
ncbi:Protein of unknown function, partial [Gryllus bimaculatus]